MPTRRELMARGAALAAALAGLGLLPIAAEATWPRRSFHAAPLESSAITISGPDATDNGELTPIGVSTTLPAVRRLLLLVEDDPWTLCAVFELSDAVEPNILTRVRIGHTSNLLAVAQTADGRVLFAQKKIVVTLGGLGG